MFDKIGKSLKSFIKSDLGKVAIGVGSSFLLPGIGPTAAADFTAFLRESQELYAFAATQGRKVT